MPGRNATSIADMSQIKSAIRETILASRLEKVGLDNSRMKEITFIPLDFSTERITEKGRAGSGMASVMFGFAIGFLLYMSIVIYGQTIMSGVLEEKTTRVAEVVMSSVPTDTLLAGNVLGVGAVGLAQQIIWIVTTYVLLKLRAPIMAKLGAPTMNFTLPDISLGAGIIFLLFFLLGVHLLLVALRGGWVVGEQRVRGEAGGEPVDDRDREHGRVHPASPSQSDWYDRKSVVAGPRLIADHHADTNGGDRGAAARAGGESRIPRGRMPCRIVACVEDLPRGPPYVREEAHDEGDG